MRLAMVTAFPVVPDKIDGGVAGVARYLADSLKEKTDIEINVIVPKAAASEKSFENRDGLRIYRLHKKKIWSFLPGVIYDLFVGKGQLNKLLERINPDIVHYQAGLFLASNSACPSVVTIHGIVENDAYWDRKWGFFWWLKWLALRLTEEYSRKRIQNVILNSDYVRQFLPDNVLGSRTWRINNPIADSFFNVPWAYQPGRVFCCSRVRPIKNIVGLIRAFNIVAEKIPGAELLIAGKAEPDYLQACMQEISVNNLGPKVHFLGDLSISEIQAELQKANCLAMTSFQENAPLAIEEAMAVGVPVVGACVGGIPEILENGRTGFLVDPHSTKEISEAICNIMRNADLAASMSQRAKQIAGARFRASVVCQQTYLVYKEILSGYRAQIGETNVA